ncbi:MULTISPECIES: hypothetical protein [Cyanophyceae]|uniref:hypothetical protein n=1 Tax=Cyanophyceae TaxID=3028117 RepID=UPI0016821EED|nr:MULTISPECIES: hypothetical protein [Cyanophyceae]MBD1916576.1 hypothetical protein [Phormidium sp. FACHB-77]MBD2032143.1 hypothetical protein [Phormidium sp. FACHB-322]MBD2053023.1 hypothetical protein [Leptolyngbya sp. FACHB-60]
MSELTQLSSEEQWTLLSYLVSQLHARTSSLKNSAEAQDLADSSEINKLLDETRGSWGQSSVEEIDAEIERQRKLSWGD